MNQLTQYLNQLIEDWEEKIEELEEEETQYLRRQYSAQRQLAFYKVKLAAIRDNQKEFSKQLQAAKRKLTDCGTEQKAKP